MPTISIKPYLQLIRLPNVFTAGADSLAGWLFIGGSLTDSPRWGLLVLASMAIYAGGIALNDVFDVEIDRMERPTRPIPSGRVAYRTALFLSVSLLGIGLLLAALTREPRTIAVASLLVASVFAYDWGLRTTKLGPQVMGLCRSLNLLLGMSMFDPLFSNPLVWVLIVSYGAFVTGVTWISRNEVSGSDRSLLKLGTGLQALAFAGFGLVVVASQTTLEHSWAYKAAGLSVLAFLAVVVFRKDAKAIAMPGPQTIQTAVKTAIFSLVWLHVGLLLGVRGLVAALVVSLFWFPAMYAGRWIYST